MRKDTKIVKVSTSKKLFWPQLCVLCLKESTKIDLKEKGLKRRISS